MAPFTNYDYSSGLAALQNGVSGFLKARQEAQTAETYAKNFGDAIDEQNRRAVGGGLAGLAPTGQPTAVTTAAPAPEGYSPQGRQPSFAAMQGQPQGTGVDDVFSGTARRLASDLQKDFSLAPHQAAGVVGQLGQESGGFRTLQEISPTVPGSRGGFGYAQWTGPRRQQFEQFAAQSGLDPNSYEANYGFLRHELQNTPEGRALDSVRQAGDATTAGRVFTDTFLRPGKPAYAQRDAWTNRAVSAIGAGQGAPQMAQGALSADVPAQGAAEAQGFAIPGQQPPQAAPSGFPTAPRRQQVTSPQQRDAIINLIKDPGTRAIGLQMAQKVLGSQKQQFSDVAQAMGGQYQIGPDNQIHWVVPPQRQEDAELKQLQIQKQRRELEGEGAIPLTEEERAGYNIAPGQAAYKTRDGSIKFGPAGTNISVDTRGEKEYDKQTAKDFAEMNRDIIKGAQSANQKIATLNRLDTLLSDPTIWTGAGGQLVLQAQRLAQAAGIKTEGLAGAEAVNAIGNQFALELRNPSGGAGMPGALSDGDRTFLQEMTPGLEKTPEGNRLIIDYMRRVAKRSVEVESLRRDYIRQHKRLDEGFYDRLAEFSEKNPLFPEANRGAKPAAGGAQPQPQAPGQAPPQQQAPASPQAPPQQPGGKPKTAINPKTGERLIMDPTGNWTPYS